jgi:hypothetical protein
MDLKLTSSFLFTSRLGTQGRYCPTRAVISLYRTRLPRSELSLPFVELTR